MTAVAKPAAPVRDRILTAARALLEEEGFRALSTRTVAARAGCSIGTIYNYFSDFDDVVLHLNAETVSWLSSALAKAAKAERNSRPTAIVDAYFDFLEANDAAWSALFQHFPPANYVLPDWYRDTIASTLRVVIDGLSEAISHLPAQKREDLVVALWSGLHGLASLDRQRKLTTVTTTASARELGHLLIASALKGADWPPK